jgi:hypothetical protein
MGCPDGELLGLEVQHAVLGRNGGGDHVARLEEGGIPLLA